jgi:hypothetical protein
MTEPATSDERTVAAFRGAIAALDVPVAVDPAVVRSRVRRRRVREAVAGGVLALAALVTLPTALHSNVDPVRALAHPAEHPASWRTEHYRNITFSVPSSWPYAYEPNTDCAELRNKHGYVALERPRARTLEGCAHPDDSATLNEHVVVAPATGYWSEDPRGRQHVKGWWLQDVLVGEVRLRVVSRERAVVERVAGSAAVVMGSSAGVCTPHHALERDSAARPRPGFDVAGLTAVDSITLCQYDPVEAGDLHTSGLTARAVLSGQPAADLLVGIQHSRVNTSGGCRPPSPDDDRKADLAVVLYLTTGKQTHPLYLSAAGCTDSDRRAVAGFDDGTTVRRISRETCQAALVPPLGIEMATTTEVFNACG